MIWEATPGLRFWRGELQQLWKGYERYEESVGHVGLTWQWRAVPYVDLGPRFPPVNPDDPLEGIRP